MTSLARDDCCDCLRPRWAGGGASESDRLSPPTEEGTNAGKASGGKKKLWENARGLLTCHLTCGLRKNDHGRRPRVEVGLAHVVNSWSCGVEVVHEHCCSGGPVMANFSGEGSAKELCCRKVQANQSGASLQLLGSRCPSQFLVVVCQAMPASPDTRLPGGLLPGLSGCCHWIGCSGWSEWPQRAHGLLTASWESGLGKEHSQEERDRLARQSHILGQALGLLLLPVTRSVTIPLQRLR